MRPRHFRGGRVVLVLLGACGGGSPGTASEAGTSGLDSGGLPTDAPGALGDDVATPDAADASAPSDSAAAGATTFAGHVNLQLTTFPGIAPSGSASAVFGGSGSLPGVLDCPAGVPTVGSCCFIAAPPADGGRLGALQVDAGVIDSVSAGDIAFTDDGAPFGTLHFSGQGYPILNNTGTPAAERGWVPGHTLAVTGSGGTVPAFSGSVVAPDALLGVSPSPTAPVISVSSDWTVAWTPSPTTPSKISLELTAYEAPPPVDLVKCVVDDAAGTLTVPASLLGHLKPISATSIIVSRAARSTAGSGGNAVEILAFATVEGNAMLVP